MKSKVWAIPGWQVSLEEWSPTSTLDRTASGTNKRFGGRNWGLAAVSERGVPRIECECGDLTNGGILTRDWKTAGALLLLFFYFSRRPPNGPPNVQAFPRHWDKTQVPEIGYKKVLLQDSSKEYKKVETLFRQTMTAFDIVKIERIQNKFLWDQFQLQREQMKKRNEGRNVAERKLFHGTDPKFINAICCSNFDWRICGTHGTSYGKGSYFARDASYSHNFTRNASTVHSLFVSRVLVGDHTLGAAGYVRPPSKDGGDTLFYDSCANNILSPSIFVVFDRPQIYPEFLLTYKEKAAVMDHSPPRLLRSAPSQQPYPAPPPPTSVPRATPAHRNPGAFSNAVPTPRHYAP
ncbi:protein mono-ADP-ribosyltransferase PARP12-like [Gadus morhua]|uniref:protein mono-ADP-ribosyltransferase PARP12-like n=1 Tax=Gadus morhua TaxID=8049 RepID=UPI0011B5CF55|nr:protein mono-ADP-ribosyltransferase PARP12-like [Gadus morhua]